MDIYTEKEKKKIHAEKARQKQKAKWRGASTAQQTIPYRQMYKDGLCQVSGHFFTRTLEFGDITYQLADNDDRRVILDGYRDFHNYFDPSVSVQISCYNQVTDLHGVFDKIDIAAQGDGFDDIRKEYSDIIKEQMAKGNNGRERHKFVTYGIEAKDIRDARVQLESIERSVRKNFKDMGVSSTPQMGVDRLRFLYQTLNEGTKVPFNFSFDKLVKTGLSTKDFIAPSSFDFRDGKAFRMGNIWGTTLCMQILAPELSDKMLSEFLDLDVSIAFNLHIKSVDQAEAIKLVKGKISDLDKMKIEEQKKAVRAGYDMDVLPPDLVAYGSDYKELLEDLGSRNERLFLVTILIMTTAKTRKQLENTVLEISRAAAEKNCPLLRLDFQQEEGLVSSLPLGINAVDIRARTLTTSSTAIMVPFTTEELFQKGEALYYGVNAKSSNIILGDRKTLKNPNGLILGTPGAGKSFSAKREMINVFLVTNDDIIICDPEGEYSPLCEVLKGQLVNISPTSQQFINPMDININYGEGTNPVTLKAGFILSLCDIIMDGIEPIERTIIDRAVRLVYADYLADPRPENMPTLGDLHRVIAEQHEDVAQRIATKLEIYVAGSLNVFNHRTNVDLNNRIICFDTKELGEQLKKLGMLIVQDQVWNRVTQNRAAGKTTRYYVDEFHLLLKTKQTAEFSVSIWKRFRKWGGIPTGITQNVKDFLASDEVSNIFENSDFIYMLNQRGADREILARHLSISSDQLSFITNSDEGEGLLFFGSTIIPFRDHFPKDTKLYRVMTTKPSELLEQKRSEGTA